MIYIVTPCSRPENLETISESIPSQCKWIVLHEPHISIPKIHNINSIVCPKTGFVGADGRNYFINNFNLKDDDWIYPLDDDNIIHPDLIPNILELLDMDISIIHWGQLNKNQTIRLHPKIAIDKIDAACFISKWKYNKYIKYNTIKYNYDGLYAIECANNGPVVKLNMYLCYYNYLRN
jgi:hypothetical protein